MTIGEIKTVCFVGAGTMGCFNSLVAGLAGYEALVWDQSSEALDQMPHRLDEMGARLVERGYFTQAQMDEGLPRIHQDSDPVKVAARADLLSESVFEKLDLKRKVHRQFEDLCPSHTILTTNTSSLLVSRIEEAVSCGERFAALHAHLFSGLFDIVGGPRTSPETIEILTRYVRSLGGLPIVLRKERPGYLYNTMFGSTLRTAMMLVIEGRARMEDVDRAWMSGFNALAGPFGMMDYIGLNVILDGATENLMNAEKAEDSQKIIELVHPLVDRGDLGAKTGKGFYNYPDPVFSLPGFVSERAPRDHLVDDFLVVLGTTALLLVIEEYATFPEVDLAWMVAKHADLGPFAMIDKKGLDLFTALLETGPGRLVQPMNKQKILAFLDPYLKRGDWGAKTGRGFYSYPDPAFSRPEFLLG